MERLEAQEEVQPIRAEVLRLKGQIGHLDPTRDACGRNGTTLSPQILGVTDADRQDCKSGVCILSGFCRWSCLTDPVNNMIHDA